MDQMENGIDFHDKWIAANTAIASGKLLCDVVFSPHLLLKSWFQKHVGKKITDDI